MKIVVLTSRFPYPIEKGDKLRMYHQLRYLTTIHEVHLISISHDDIGSEEIAHVKELCASVQVLEMTRRRSIANAVLSVFNQRPFQVNFFYSKKHARRISNLIDELNPDLIYCQLIRMSEYVKGLSYPKVLDFMDAFSLNYARRIKHESIIGKNFFRIENKRLVKYEHDVVQDFEEAVIISAGDHHHIGADKNITVISNGLDTNYFKPKRRENSFDLVFVGNMGYNPNILAAKFLVQKISPHLEKKARILIAGARPSPSIVSLENEMVKVSGWLDDIRDAYGSSKIFVAPIFTGAGQQNKILEAMSMELICITSSIVNVAIQAEEGKEILIANTAQEFSNLIDKVMKNMSSYEEIGVNARKFVQSKFSWENENGKLNKILLKARKECKNEV